MLNMQLSDRLTDISLKNSIIDKKFIREYVADPDATVLSIFKKYQKRRGKPRLHFETRLKGLVKHTPENFTVYSLALIAFSEGGFSYPDIRKHGEKYYGTTVDEFTGRTVVNMTFRDIDNVLRKLNTLGRKLGCRVLLRKNGAPANAQIAGDTMTTDTASKVTEMATQLLKEQCEAQGIVVTDAELRQMVAYSLLKSSAMHSSLRIDTASSKRQAIAAQEAYEHNKALAERLNIDLTTPLSKRDSLELLKRLEQEASK